MCFLLHCWAGLLTHTQVNIMSLLLGHPPNLWHIHWLNFIRPTLLITGISNFISHFQFNLTKWRLNSKSSPAEYREQATQLRVWVCFHSVMSSSLSAAAQLSKFITQRYLGVDLQQTRKQVAPKCPEVNCSILLWRLPLPRAQSHCDTTWENIFLGTLTCKWGMWLRLRVSGTQHIHLHFPESMPASRVRCLLIRKAKLVSTYTSLQLTW